MFQPHISPSSNLLGLAGWCRAEMWCKVLSVARWGSLTHWGISHQPTPALTSSYGRKPTHKRTTHLNVLVCHLVPQWHARNWKPWHVKMGEGSQHSPASASHVNQTVFSRSLPGLRLHGWYWDSACIAHNNGYNNKIKESYMNDIEWLILLGILHQMFCRMRDLDQGIQKFPSAFVRKHQTSPWLSYSLKTRPSSCFLSTGTGALPAESWFHQQKPLACQADEPYIYIYIYIFIYFIYFIYSIYFIYFIYSIYFIYFIYFIYCIFFIYFIYFIYSFILSILLFIIYIYIHVCVLIPTTSMPIII